MASDFVTLRREEAWDFGQKHRETVVAEWMRKNGESARPLFRNIIDDVIEDMLGARLREEVLPLDRFAQTELVDGRLEVSINSRIGSMAKVKDIAGVIYAAKCHESVHVVRDFPSHVSPGAVVQPAFASFDVEVPRLVACRGYAEARDAMEKSREFFAENAGVATAVCPEDLARCPEYLEFMALADVGGNLGKNGWRLLYRSAEFIGINATVLARYWQNQGLLQIDGDGQLLAQKSMGGFGHGW